MFQKLQMDVNRVENILSFMTHTVFCTAPTLTKNLLLPQNKMLENHIRQVELEISQNDTNSGYDG